MTRKNELTWKLLEPILLLLLAIPTAALAIAFMYGYPVFSVAWNVVAGWAYVAARALVQVEWNIAGITTGVLSFAAIIGLLHFLAAWVYREVQLKRATNASDGQPATPAVWRWRWTFGLTAAVIMMFVAGVVGVGLFRTSGWLFETTHWFQRNDSLSIR